MSCAPPERSTLRCRAGGGTVCYSEVKDALHLFIGHFQELSGW